MNYNKEHWLNVVANLRKGELLKEAACQHEQFLKAPVLLSPLAKNDYKKLKTSQLPHFSETAKIDWDITWDGVMVDEVTYKIVLLTAYCTPEDIVKTCPELDTAKRQSLTAAIEKWYGSQDPTPWLEKYFGIAEKLLLLPELNDITKGYFDRGWRCEEFIFNFTDEEGVIAATEEQWAHYYEEAWNELFPQGDEITDLFFNTVFPL